MSARVLDLFILFMWEELEGGAYFLLKYQFRILFFYLFIEIVKFNEDEMGEICGDDIT